jgi:putative ABC transport system permease protein
LFAAPNQNASNFRLIRYFDVSRHCRGNYPFKVRLLESSTVCLHSKERTLTKARRNLNRKLRKTGSKVEPVFLFEQIQKPKRKMNGFCEDIYLMTLPELIKISNRNLFRSKLRTLLTVLAIFVGAFTLVLTNGLGDGLRDYVEKQVKNLEGSSVLFVRKRVDLPKDENANPDTPREYQETRKDETGNDFDPNSFVVAPERMEALRRTMPEIKLITPRYSVDAEYITVGDSKKYQVSLGTLSEGITQKTEAGKTIDGAGQIMIPVSLAKTIDAKIDNLIGKTAIVGYKTSETSEMKTIPLKIVGVSTKGMMANYNSFIDTATAKKFYDEQRAQSLDYNKFSSYTVQLNTGDEAEIARIKKQLDEKGFAAETFADARKRTYDAIGILQIGLNLFAFIALLAASFGIINTLIIAVLERTKEIGLQKALGMGRRKIFFLFSLESILIGFWGAAFGIVGGIVIGSIANFYLARTYLESFEGYTLFVFTIPSILFVLLLVCAIAFLAGVLPALRASRLNPIEALRYE